MCYKGNHETIQTILNYERECLKKVISDELFVERTRAKLKVLDINKGQLVATTYHTPEAIKRHQDFNIRATNLFSKYSNSIVERYRSILCQKDKNGRNPLHYAAMSKFTNSYRALQVLLDINLDSEPGYDSFKKLYFEIAGLDDPDQKVPFDPRKTHKLIDEFEHLLAPREFK